MPKLLLKRMISLKIIFSALKGTKHKNDESTMAQLNLGLIAYWIVNRIWYQLKSNGINSCWREIVRIDNTQKVITTNGYNKSNEEITVRICSKPEQKLKYIQAVFYIKNRPLHKTKICSTQTKTQKSNYPHF